MNSTEMYTYLKSKLGVLNDLSLHINGNYFNVIQQLLFEDLDGLQWTELKGF